MGLFNTPAILVLAISSNRTQQVDPNSPTSRFALGGVPCYPDTIKAVKNRLRKGGLFITDNLLWSGRILEKEPEEESTRGILEFTKRLYADPDFLTSIIPIRDGLAVAVKL